MPQPIVTIQDFAMTLGGKQIIQDLSFEVYPGEVFGLLGSNGSGKTTTIRALMGIYTPTRGQLLINGQRFNPAMSGFLGYLPEERGLYKNESVIDTMLYFGQLKGLSRDQAKQWSLNYLERVDLADKAKLSIGKLSGGQQQKIQLGITIMNKPKLLILDEPTKGFDPVNRRLMLELIDEAVQEGAAVILVTHHMEEVERLCKRLVLLKDGQRRLYGSIDQIKQEYSQDKVSLTYKGQLKKTDPSYAIIKDQDGQADLQIKPKHTAQQVLQSLANQDKLHLIKFDTSQVSLDDIFVDIYQGQSLQDLAEEIHHA